MKKILLQISILFLLASCNQNQKTNFESGILWRIESKSGIESFIFGTIHLYPRTQMELSKNVISKLEECNILALERDVTNKSEQQKFADFEMPAFFMESYRIIIEEYGDELISMESQLMEKAFQLEMDLNGLESTDEILDIMKKVSDIEVPKNTYAKNKMLSDYQKSLEQYKTKSIGQFYKRMTAEMGQEFTTMILDKRNENWIEDIESLIENDKIFIAVGMGHLGGENGILNLLEKKGYGIQRVE
jgi:uncharacterized protein YbaP (TraB family)